MNGPGLAKASPVASVARSAFDEVSALIARLEAENAALRAEVNRLARENDELLDEVYELTNEDP